MKANVIKIVICVVIVCVLIIAFVLSGNKKDIGSCTQYRCDVKNLTLSTTIEIDKGDKDFAKVSGNIFTFLTDPLTMYD